MGNYGMYEPMTDDRRRLRPTACQLHPCMRFARLLTGAPAEDIVTVGGKSTIYL
jgi:hypothetical protein